jgi:ubiquinol-cytochrome c reductase cytochrome c subunit
VFVLNPGCGTGTGGAAVNEVMALDGNTSNGAALFASQCSGCHGSGGSGGSGGSILGVTNPDSLTSFILSGPGEMPAFGSILTDQEISDVVWYVVDVLQGSGASGGGGTVVGGGGDDDDGDDDRSRAL